MHALSCPSLAGCLELIMDAVCVVDAEGRFVYVSGAAERIFGYTPAEMLGRPMIELVHPDDRERTLATARQIMAHQPQLHFENRYVRKNGEIAHIMWSARWSEVDRVRVAVARDVTPRKRAEATQVALYAISEATHLSNDLHELCGQVHHIVANLLPVNRFAVSLVEPGENEPCIPYDVTCRPAAEADRDPTVPRRCLQLMRAAMTAAECCADDSPDCLCAPLETGGNTLGIVLVRRHPDDRSYTPQDRELLHFIARQIAAAIERKQLYERLKQSAFHDQLTGLPNRALLQDRLQSAIARARREDSEFVLLFVDLDKFKEINDLHGHLVGDMVLVQAARRLESAVRRSDTVARLGGDEFVILLDQIRGEQPASHFVEKLRDAFAAPIMIAGLPLQITPSIGSAAYPLDGTDERQLLAHADAAMYAAKHLPLQMPAAG